MGMIWDRGRGAGRAQGAHVQAVVGAEDQQGLEVDTHSLGAI